jgi:hypothetical protein
MRSVFGKAEKVEHLGDANKTDFTSLLPEGQRGDPDGNEPVLAERQAELEMTSNLQEKAAVATCGGADFVLGDEVGSHRARTVEHVVSILLLLASYRDNTSRHAIRAGLIRFRKTRIYEADQRRMLLADELRVGRSSQGDQRQSGDSCCFFCPHKKPVPEGKLTLAR